MKKLIVIAVVFILGCDANTFTETGPRLGSIFHPETNLVQFSDLELLNEYESLLIAIDYYEADLAKLEAGEVRPETRLAASLPGINKTTIQAGLEEKKHIQEKTLKEIQRRGLTPLEHQELDTENLRFGLSLGLRWDTFKTDKVLKVQKVLDSNAPQ